MAKNEQITSNFVIVQPDNGMTPALPDGSVSDANIVDVSETKVTGVTAGSIPFVGSNLKFTEDNAKLFWNDTNTRMGIGTNTPAIGNVSAGRSYLTIKGNTDLACVEMVSGTAVDAANTILGQLAWTDALNVSADKRTTLIQGITEGIVANNRGGAFSIRTRLDGGSSIVEHAYLNNRGYFGIGSNSKLSMLTITPIADFTASGTTTANATTAITGVSSNFLVEIGIGDRISLSSAATTFATVTAIGSSTGLTVDANLGDGTSQTILVKKSVFRADTTTQTGAVTISDRGGLLTAAGFTSGGSSVQGILAVTTLTGDTGHTSGFQGIRSAPTRTITVNTTDSNSGMTAFSASAPVFNVPAGQVYSNNQATAGYAAYSAVFNPTIVGGGTLAIDHYIGINIAASATASGNRKSGLQILGVSGASNNAFINDNPSFVGDWFINSTNTNQSRLSGNLGIGTDPTYRLDVMQASATVAAIRYSNNSGTQTADLRFLSDNVSFLNNWAGIRAQQEGGTDTHNLQFFTAPTAAAVERLRITAAGKMLFGGFSTPRGAIGADSVSANDQQEGSNTNASGATLLVGNNSNNLGAIYQMAKTRGTTPGAVTVVQSGDIIARMEFLGADGTTLIPAAQMKVEVDGTPGTNDMPGRIVFSTTADGTSSVLERWRIDSAGRISSSGSVDTASLISIDNAQGQNSLTSTSQYGLSSFIGGSSAATGNVTGISSAPATQAASFTCGAMDGFLSRNFVKGVGSTITNATAYRGVVPTVGTNNAFMADNSVYTGQYFINSTSTNQSLLSGLLNLAKGSSLGLTIGDVSTNSTSLLRIQGTSAGYNWQLANNFNLTGFEITPSTATGGVTYTTPLMSFSGVNSAVGIGLGTTAPTIKLQVSGSSEIVRLQGTTPFLNVVCNATNNYLGSASALVSGGVDTDFALRAQNNLSFAIGTTLRAQLSTNGGFTLTPAANNGVTVTAANNTSTQSNLYAFNGSSVAGVFNGDLSGGMSTGSNGAASMMRLAMATATSRSINAAGTINASGADYAEYMFKDVPEEVIAPAEVCGIKANGKLTKKWSEAIRFVVKSTAPAYVGGDTWAPEELEGESREDYNVRHEVERVKVDRIAFCGQVPCIVTGDFEASDWIIAQEGDDDAIEAVAVADSAITFAQHRKAIGQVWKEIDSTTALVAVKL